MQELLCSPISPTYLFISPNVPAYIYYSHSIALITSFLMVVYILRSKESKLVKSVLTFTLSAFATWVFHALVFWASNRGDVIMFTWSIDILVEPLVYIGALYLLHLLLEKKDLSFKHKVLLFLLYLPMLVFVPTKYTLSGFDLATCFSIEGPIALYYTYFIELLVTIIIIVFSFHKFYKPGNLNRKEILSLSVGTILFLFAFAWGNIIGSFTENWQLAQFGLFGMPLFIGFLTYSIVKYRTFNTKIIGAQALVIALIVLIASTLLVDDPSLARTIILATLVLVIGLGYSLTQSVKREVEQRERIEKLAKELGEANDKLKELDVLKSEFLSLATHQIRSPLTAIRGYASMVLQGDFGQVPIQARDAI